MPTRSLRHVGDMIGLRLITDAAVPTKFITSCRLTAGR